MHLDRFGIVLGLCVLAGSASAAETPVAKRVLRPEAQGKNLLRADAWRPYEKGFSGSADAPVCDNGSDVKARCGVVQTVLLNQTRPEPIIARAASKAEGVTGLSDSDYSIYLDLVYADGTPLWGQVANFSTGTHDWQLRQVVVVPTKPIKQLSFYLLLRNHGGRASFRDAEIRALKAPPGACRFDGVLVAPTAPAREGFQVRDVAADGDYLALEGKDAGYEIAGVMKDHKAGLNFIWHPSRGRPHAQNRSDDARACSISVTDTTGKDRAITLVYTLPIAGRPLRWLGGLRQDTPVEPGWEYVDVVQFHAGSDGRLSRYPLAAVADGRRGQAIAIVPDHPAFCRLGYNAGTGELFAAFDLALTPENPHASLAFELYPFDAAWGFRSALDRYYRLHPKAFRCRTPEQGLWMPFAKISQVERWEDFGFKFKEGNDETAWDDKHGILTFRYTEPMTWWMPMPKDMPRTREAAEREARRLADAGRAEAKALLTSGFHDAEGRLVGRMLDTPWCNGTVWSVNSMPEIKGEVTDFKNRWNAKIQRELYTFGPRGTGLDGEYVDSSEGYATEELDFRRDHFRAAQTPLVFSLDDRRPAIFRGMIAYEYIRGMSWEIRSRDRLLMANGTPGGLWWLAPLLDVMGTEADWNHEGRWRPMSDADLLYRRALCKGKPYCFLMNTRFEQFPPELVEKYMKRCLAYGMFPGFFSPDAARAQYFTRPELYNRDRPLFRRYIPLCKRVAEAGWEPITRATSSDPGVHVERFGERYLTVFNDSRQGRTAVITLEAAASKAGRELLSGRPIAWPDGRFTLTLDGEDVAVIDLAP